VQLYCLDTSVFINGWNKHYPPEVFPKVWTTMEEAFGAGRVSCPREVLEEMRKKTDTLREWADLWERIFHEHSEAVQKAFRTIVNHQDYQKLQNPVKGRSTGDAWVVAHAQVHNAIVVAEEMPKNERSTKVKIPDVCRALKVKCIKTVDFLKDIGFVT
jgi:hypothetical protein